MPRVRVSQNSFTNGEISPRMLGRTDFDRYFDSVETLENCIVFPHGGITRRPGTKFVAEEKTMSKKVRLVSFEFNDIQAYVLEFGENYFRIYRNGAQVVSGGPVEVATSYTESELFELQFAQSADTLWVVHRNHKPQKITRSSDTSWSIDNYAPTADPFTGAGDYPRAIAFWKNRLWFAGTDNSPQKIWSTKAGDFENMTTGTGDDDAITIEIASGKVNTIQWLAGASKSLQVGTLGSEFSLKGDIDGIVTPSNIAADPETKHGSMLTQPVQVSNSTLFITRSKRKLRQLIFDYDTDGLVAPDLTILSEHITKGGLVQVDYQQEEDSIVWMIRSDGTLISMTFLKEQNVVGWGRHTTKGEFESVAVIPHPDGDRDQVWVSVKRTINGATKRYVEYLEDGDGFYGKLNTDCALTGDFSPTKQTTVSGLGHLEAEEVDIVGDGAVYPTDTVSSGEVELQSPGAEIVEVGLDFDSTVVTLLPEAEDVSILGLRQSRAEISIRILESLGFTFGTGGDLEQVPFRKASDPMDAPPPLFTGVKVVPNLGWGPEASKVTIKQTQPLPLTILAITSDLEVGDV